MARTNTNSGGGGAVDITQVDLITAIENSTLIPGQWYLITDYRTNAPVIGSPDGTMFLGDVEQIMVMATGVNEIAPQGYSVTNPSEIIEFDATKIVYTQNMYIEYDSGHNYGTIAFTPITSNTFSIDVALGTITDENFYLYVYDNDTDSYVEYSISDLGVTFEYDNTTQTFTLLNLAGSGVDLTDSLFVEMYVQVATGEVSNGLITKRRNILRDITVDLDYRGRKVRRWKANVIDWTSGTYNLNDTVKYGGFVWVCLETTTDTPTTSSSKWQQMTKDTYVIPQAYFNPKYYIPVNESDYEDYFIFDITQLDTHYSILNLEIKSYAYGDNDLNIYFEGNINSSINSVINVSNQGATITDSVINSTITLDNSVIRRAADSTAKLQSFSGAIDRCTINSANVSCTSQDGLVMSTINYINYSSFNSNSAYITANSLNFVVARGLIEYMSISSANSVTFKNYVRGLVASRIFSTSFNTIRSGSFYGYCYNNIFHTDLLESQFFHDVGNNEFHGHIFGTRFYSLVQSNNVNIYFSTATFFDTVFGNTFSGISGIANCTFNDLFNHNTGNSQVNITGSKFMGEVTDNSFQNVQILFNDVKFLSLFTFNTFGNTSTDYISMGDVLIGQSFTGNVINNSRMSNCTFLGRFNQNTMDISLGLWHFVTALGNFANNTITATYQSVLLPIEYSYKIISTPLLKADLSSEGTKTGATQLLAGAVAGENWVTNGHATLPDGVILRGV